MPTGFQEWMWWVFSALILAFILNILSNQISRRLDNPIDRWTEQYSNRQKAINEKRRKRIVSIAELFIEDPHQLALEQQSAIMSSTVMWISILGFQISFYVMAIGLISADLVPTEARQGINMLIVAATIFMALTLVSFRIHSNRLSDYYEIMIAYHGKQIERLEEKDNISQQS